MRETTGAAGLSDGRFNLRRLRRKCSASEQQSAAVRASELPGVDVCRDVKVRQAVLGRGGEGG